MKTYLFALALLLSACAEPVSNASTHTPKAQDQTTTEIQAKAIKYIGRTPIGQTCNLYISQHEDLGYLLKIEHSTHDGHQPSDDKGEMVSFLPENGRFYDIEDSPEGAKLTLSAIRLNDENLTPDLNQLTEYIQNVQLEQFLKVNFTDGLDLAAFETAIHLALEHDEFNSAQLNMVSSLDMITLHIDHYHNPSCMNFSPDSINEVEFKLGHDDGDHDHDHDHH